MKFVRGTIQPSGCRMVHFMDPENLDLLRFEKTGENARGIGLCHHVEQHLMRGLLLRFDS